MVEQCDLQFGMSKQVESWFLSVPERRLMFSLSKQSVGKSRVSIPNEYVHNIAYRVSRKLELKLDVSYFMNIIHGVARGQNRGACNFTLDHQSKKTVFWHFQLSGFSRKWVCQLLLERIPLVGRRFADKIRIKGWALAFIFSCLSVCYFVMIKWQGHICMSYTKTRHLEMVGVDVAF